MLTGESKTSIAGIVQRFTSLLRAYSLLLCKAKRVQAGHGMSRHKAQIPLVVVLVSLQGCMVGPDYQRPDTVVDKLGAFIGVDDNADTAETGDTTDTIASDAMPEWWRNLDDPVLNAQIDDMLANNLRLRQARARVNQAWERRTIAEGDLYPHLSADAEARRSFSPSASFTTGIPGASGGGSTRVFDNNIEASLATTWQLDLFGRSRREAQAAGAQARAAIADKRALAHSLIAELARRRVAIRSLRERMNLQSAMTDNRKRTLDVIKRRYKQGTDNVTVDDLHNARQAISEARSRLAELRRGLREEYNRLDVLLGRAPETREEQEDFAHQLKGPQAATPGIVPAKLVDRRPDLRASILRYKAANADIGVAVADLYPDFSVSANIGSQAERAGNILTSSDQMIGSIMGQITQRLFQGGALRANIDLQEEEAREHAAQYAEDVLNAVSEVETALSNDNRQRERIDHIRASLESARAAERASQRRYRKGVVPLRDYLGTKRARLRIEDNLVQARRSAWNARISLYLALGGDWMQDNTNRNSKHAPDRDQQEQNRNG